MVRFLYNLSKEEVKHPVLRLMFIRREIKPTLVIMQEYRCSSTTYKVLHNVLPSGELHTQTKSVGIVRLDFDVAKLLLTFRIR
jgi:hypothetical protein